MTYKAVLLISVVMFLTGCAAIPGHESREVKAKAAAEKYCQANEQGRKAIRARVNKILAGEVRIDCLADGVILHYVRRF